MRQAFQLQDFKFILPIHIRWNDLDPLHHVNNVYYFEYFQMGRGVYMNTVSSEWDWAKHMFVIAHIECDYFQELKLTAIQPCMRLRTIDLGTKSFNIEYLVTSQDGQGNEMIHARGLSTQVLIDVSQGKSIALPEWLRSDLIQYDGPSAK